MYYFYCIKLERSEAEFLESSLVKIHYILDKYQEELQAKKKAYENNEYSNEITHCDMEDIL